MKYRVIKDLPFAKVGTEVEIRRDVDMMGWRIIWADEKFGHTHSWDFDWGDPLASGFFEPIKPKRWRAEDGGKYFHIFLDERLDVNNAYEAFDEFDTGRCDTGNYFKEFAQAAEAARRIKKVLSDYQDELMKEV